MGPIYFDVTDIIEYARHSKRVSGIQRVLFSLLGRMGQRHGQGQVRCVFHHKVLDSFVEVDADVFFTAEEFDAGGLLWRLGFGEGPAYLPGRQALKTYLRQFDANKQYRALQKIRVLALARFAPARLERLGLQPQAPGGRVQRAEMRPRAELPSDATYVILGANWAFDKVHAYAQRHRDRGGVVAQMVYDLIPLTHASLVPDDTCRDFRIWLEKALSYSSRLMCISQWTANDLRRYIGQRPGNWSIDVVPLAHEFEGFARDKRVDQPSPPLRDLVGLDFVLCVGTIEIRKNGAALLKAWKRLAPQLGDRMPHLVFAGKQGWLLTEFQRTLRDDRLLGRYVHIVDSPSDRDLAYLYQNARFTVFPSLAEGWGLPVGESAWFGKYCIASSATSIPEVCGDAIDYVDPLDADGLASALQRAIEAPDYVASRSAALQQMPMRRWSDVAESLYRIVTRDPSETETQGRRPSGAVPA